MSRKKNTSEYANILYEMTQGIEGDDLSKKISFFVSQITQLHPTDSTWKKIISDFKKVYNQKEGIVEAHATFRHRMTNEDKKEIIQFLKKYYPNKHITVIDHIDERILGGIKIQAEDRLFDFTVENSLRSLHKQLTH